MKRFAAWGAVVTFVWGWSVDASAHPVTVDGLATEWFAQLPPDDDAGRIARSERLLGEYVWRDAVGDERTDVAMPDGQGDLDVFRVTTTGAGVHFFATFPGALATVGDGAPMLQIAIDFDRVSGSGQTWFAGFAETDVHADAAWEFLVQTRFGSGSTNVTVWDPSGAGAVGGSALIVGTAGAAGATVEISVPWSMLGGIVPIDPVRFTVATFRATATDDTQDIGGTASNAIDAVTNYADPGAALNTWDEVLDRVVDYHFEVWANPANNNEPFPPIVFSEVFYDYVMGDPAGELVEVFNVTGRPIDLLGWSVGDAAVVDSAAEGMVGFPNGRAIDPGEALVVAQETITFEEVSLGYDPDFEINDTDSFVPNMVATNRWATGTVAFDNGGDEAVLLDPYFTAVDVVSWGTGSYPGVTAMATTSTSALHRDPVRGDTDDVSADFFYDTPGPGYAFDPCSGASTGDACDDGDNCTSGDVCDSAGACVGGAAVTCASDGNECTADVCDPAFVFGCHPPQPAGTACADTTSGDCWDAACDGAASCDQTYQVESASYLCRADAGDCDVADFCTGTSGTCPQNFEPSTVECRGVAGDCDVAELCTGASADCPADTFRPDTYQCRIAGGECDPAEYCTGSGTACPVDAVAADGTSCGDGAVCNGDETCSGGVCVTGTAPDCSDGNACTADACNEPSGCSSSSIAGCCNTSADCSDGDVCTADACSGPGGTCSSSPITNCCVSDADCTDGSVCTTDSCNPSTNRCVFTTVTGCCTTDADCADTDACTSDSCNAATGECTNAAIAGCCNTDGDCGDGDVCTSDLCSGPGGTCSFPAIAGCCVAASDCSDTDVCTADGCDTLINSCEFSTVPGCCTADADCDDADACTTDTCDGATNRCAFADITGCCNASADCEDGNLCTTDTCDLVARACESTVISGCCETAADCDDGNGCTLDTCEADRCTHAPVDGCADGGTADAGLDGGVTDGGDLLDGSVPADAAAGDDAGPDAALEDGSAMGFDARAFPDGGTPEDVGDPADCSCRAPGGGGGDDWGGLALALGLLFVVARRRARRRL